MDQDELKNLRKAQKITVPVSVMNNEQKRSYKVLQTCGWVEPMNYCGTGRTCFKTTPEGERIIAEADTLAFVGDKVNGRVRKPDTSMLSLKAAEKN